MHYSTALDVTLHTWCKYLFGSNIISSLRPIGTVMLMQTSDKTISKDEKTIVFVYNADSGIINSVKDYFQKIVNPSTYSCNLCALTFNNTGMKKEWKGFIEDVDAKVEFLHLKRQEAPSFRWEKLTMKIF